MNNAAVLAAGPVLCQSRQPKLFSLLDMQKFYAHSFVRISSVLQDLSNIGEYVSVNLIEVALKLGIERDLGVLKAECQALQMEHSLKHIDRINSFLAEHGPEGSSTVFREYLEELHRRVQDEIEVHLFLEVRNSAKDYFENPILFGPMVSDRFPEAIDDISEAGTCLALDRGTACVMHLMRVVEVGLKALAEHLELPNRNDWGKHLKDIEDELTKRYKASGCRSPEEAFFSEAASQIGHIKTAKRNPTMHADRNYDPKRAEEILIAVRSFMQHLVLSCTE